MAIHDVNPKCFILALFVRDDGERFLLGDGYYEFKDSQLQFQANTVANDVIEVQGNDGYLLAGQVRRPGTQSFDGYIGDGLTSKPDVEQYRRDFFQFFRKNYFYKVVYVFPDGTAIQRKRGFLVDDPTVSELYQQYPEYHVALNFEDINYYSYSENDEGEEIYAKEALIYLSAGATTGGLVWDEYGVVWEDTGADINRDITVVGKDLTIQNPTDDPVPVTNLHINGDTFQHTYSGKNLYQTNPTSNNGLIGTLRDDGMLSVTGQATNQASDITTAMTTSLPAGTYTFSITQPVSFRVLIRDDALGSNVGVIQPGDTQATFTTTSTLTTLRVFFYLLETGTTYNETIGLQLEAGNQKTTFEPYVGGTVSPNPDYPQDVQVVTGEQTVEVTGKNLAKPYQTSGTLSKNGVTLTMNNDGSITLNGTSTGNSWLQFVGAFTDNPAQNYTPVVPLSPDKTYTFSYSVKEGTISGEGYLLMQYDNPDDTSGRETSLTLTQSGRSSTFTGKTGVYRMWVRSYSGAVYNNFVVQPQVEVGSTATTYEPYQGQSYPVDLRGTNLLDLNSFVIGGMSSGAPSPTTKYRINNADKPIKVEPDTAYTISAQLVSPVQGFRVGIHECQADGTFIRDLGWKQLATAATTFTTGSTTGLVKIVGSLSTTSTNVSTGNTENTTACDTVAEFMRGCTLMLEEGSSASAYLPYNPVELCKIGDYQDYIYKSDDDWYVHKAIGKVVFNGSENWALVTGNHQRLVLYDNSVVTQAYNESAPVVMASDYFLGSNWYKVYETGYGDNLISSHNSAGGFYIRALSFESVSDFKTWLSTHNTTVYYALVTPTDTKITDTALVNQLEALSGMTLGAGVNNVTVTSDIFNGEIQFTYRIVGVTTGGAVWEDGGGGGPTTVEVDSIDNVYPIWTITGPATDPQLSVLSTNTTINYVGNITASQTLVIDMLNKTALLNGTSVIGNVYGDWVNFAPGNNRVVYTTDNTDALPSKIEWQEVVG